MVVSCWRARQRYHQPCRLLIRGPLLIHQCPYYAKQHYWCCVCSARRALQLLISVLCRHTLACWRHQRRNKPPPLHRGCAAVSYSYPGIPCASMHLQDLSPTLPFMHGRILFVLHTCTYIITYAATKVLLITAYQSLALLLLLLQRLSMNAASVCSSHGPFRGHATSGGSGISGGTYVRLRALKASRGPASQVVINYIQDARSSSAAASKRSPHHPSTEPRVTY